MIEGTHYPASRIKKEPDKIKYLIWLMKILIYCIAIHVPSGNPASAEHLARYINIQHTVRLVLL